jgi:STE24 endopeptidase
MQLDNPWFLMALLGVIGWFHVKLLAEVLNLKRVPLAVPGALRNVVTDEDLSRARDYQVDNSKMAVMTDAVRLAVLLGFWWLGGFAWLHSWVQSLGLGEITFGVVLLGTLYLLGLLISLPFTWYDTFHIEAKYGLNRTTPGTFISDQVKSLLLLCVLGGPLLALVLWLLKNVEGAMAWAWLTTVLFGLLMTWIAPRFLMPLFLKFTPLEPGSLREGIFELGSKLQFPLQEIYVVDGSRRSSKANAFFTGIGKNRRIALFDTLIETHDEKEILAVLAHEIGHAKLGHVPKMMIVGMLQSAALFAALHLALKDVRLYEAFGVREVVPALGLALFMLIWQPWSVLLELLDGTLSRKHEFEADAFARQAVGTGETLVSALKKLSRDHLAHLTPHPFYVALHHSHPPVLQRIEQLTSKP